MDRQALEDRYNEHKRRNRQIDMTRGKPAPDQLDLSDDILSVIGRDDCFGEDNGCGKTEILRCDIFFKKIVMIFEIRLTSRH